MSVILLVKSREYPRCIIPESQSCDISGNTRTKILLVIKSPVVWNICVVIGSTDDMVCVLGNDAFYLCVCPRFLCRHK